MNEVTSAQPKNAVAWMQLGAAYLYADDVSKADAAYATTNSNGIPPFITHFQRAKIYGDKGNIKQSLEWLDKAVENGYSDLNKINNEPTLEKVRATEEFKVIIGKVDRIVNPCKYDDRHRAFDFWVGEWSVFDHQQGFQVGTSKIEKLVGDCVIYENWADSQSQGKSFNYYDPSINKWRQNWVSQNGGVIWYVGEIKDGKMEYEGERIRPNGNIIKTRVTLAPQPDGSVRQTAADFMDGKWQVNFDADYKRAK
ncbi:MAG: hypothetical protein U5K54_26085 [Cytophagales bacterium]|nr:hypothetical protein [Cytophagales bacterium]